MQVERYVILLDGVDASPIGLSSKGALGLACALVDAPLSADQLGTIAIIEEQTRELRACWTHDGRHWKVDSVAGWLS